VKASSVATGGSTVTDLTVTGSKLAGRARAIIVIEVRHAVPLVSPAYDDGATTEAEMLESQRARFALLHERHTGR
jgi:hypothetical protein